MPLLVLSGHRKGALGCPLMTDFVAEVGDFGCTAGARGPATSPDYPLLGERHRFAGGLRSLTTQDRQRLPAAVERPALQGGEGFAQ
jgi:hypothetical protein